MAASCYGKDYKEQQLAVMLLLIVLELPLNSVHILQFKPLKCNKQIFPLLMFFCIFIMENMLLHAVH